MQSPRIQSSGLRSKRSPGHVLGIERSGFTLIEVLAVILIIGVLAAFLFTQLGGAQDAIKVSRTSVQISKLSAALHSYQTSDQGDYPPSRFEDSAGVSNDGTNVGMEALVVALWSNGYEAGGLLDDEADALLNSDNDSSSRPLTDFESRQLFEIADAWDNPIAYFHRRDYDGPGTVYVTFDSETGEELESTAKAQKNPVTGRFYDARSFQLISAGSDCLFGTEDDVTSFNRREEEE